MRDLTDESADEIAVMDVELTATGRRVALRHVLLDDLVWFRSLDEHRSEIADQGRQHVTLRTIERVGAAYGVRFLAKGAEKPADDLGLAIQVDQPLLERPSEPHVVFE